MNKINFALVTVFLLFLVDFFLNAWVGLSFYSDKILNSKSYNFEQLTEKNISRAKINPDMFGIKEPILVGESMREAKRLEALEKARLAALAAEKEPDKKITRIKIGDYYLSLKAIYFDGKKLVSLLSAAYPGSEPASIAVSKDEMLFDVFVVSNIETSFISLLPIQKSDTVSDFKEVRLHIYKPGMKQEVL